jgi:oligopeptide/dipeptide ABC transporter ATP-binding protein
VIFRPIANDGARVAAMLSGDVDMIEGVPGVDRAKIAAAPNLALHEADAFRIIYLQMDSARDASPGLKDNAGNPLARNPFKDARVRQAISFAINREGLAERLLSGQAKPASQYVPNYVPGARPNLKPLPFDADRARTLMREPRHPYTRALLQSRADGALAKGQRLETIAGSPPDLTNLPQGCAFASRCNMAVPECSATHPEVTWLADGHSVRCLLAESSQVA